MGIFGWAAASNERALANARAGAVQCSRRRLERAEATQAVAELNAAYEVAMATAIARSGGHEMRVRAGAR